MGRWEEAYRREWEGQAAVDVFGPVCQEMRAAALGHRMAELREQVQGLGF